jgi:hypothetical protein
MMSQALALAIASAFAMTSSITAEPIVERAADAGADLPGLLVKQVHSGPLNDHRKAVFWGCTDIDLDARADATYHKVGREMRQSTLLETIARRLLARQGIGVIWQLHLRASASHLNGNWLSAAALIGIADAAERQWSGRIGFL